MKIWCLFSILVTEYNQPDNNLEAWFFEKPTLQVILKTLNLDDKYYLRYYPDLPEILTVFETRVGERIFRLVQCKEGVRL
jgi:hypothetical protein